MPTKNDGLVGFDPGDLQLGQNSRRTRNYRIFFRFSSNTHDFDPFNVIPGMETWVRIERYGNYLHTGF